MGKTSHLTKTKRLFSRGKLSPGAKEPNCTRRKPGLATRFVNLAATDRKYNKETALESDSLGYLLVSLVRVGIDFSARTRNACPLFKMDAPSQAARELFAQAVRAVLETWPVLQIAVDNGFGGVYSQQKADWMADAVQQYFQQNANLAQCEVEDFLADVMNDEFHTIVDDGSLPEVASQVCQLFGQCQQGKLSEVRGQIAQLSQKKVTGRAKATPVETPAEEEESEEESEEEEAMECEAGTERTSSTVPTTEQEPPRLPPPPTSRGAEEDGWTVVRRKK